jgi:hypothetical protein
MSDSNNTIPDGFRVIPGYPRYAIDENSTVLSVCSRNGRGKDRPWENATRVKQNTDRDGYYTVCLCHDGHQRTVSVHTRVLNTFVGPCPDGMVCRHLDGNHTNNHVSNLAWGTPRENSQDMILHGQSLPGEKHNMVKLTEEHVLEIRARYANGETQTSIAKDFPVTQSNISLIVRRRKWTHI